MLKVTLLTHQGYVFQNLELEAVSVPAWAGEVQILTEHAPFLTLITSGILFFENEGKRFQYAIHHGYAEVLQNKVLICVRMVERPEDIDEKRCADAYERSQMKLQDYFKEMAVDEVYQTKFQSKIARSLTRMSLKS